MAGSSGKKIAIANRAAVKQLRIGTLASLGVYVLSLFLFKAGRTTARILAFLVTSLIEVVIEQQLEGSAAMGADLAQEGLTAYMFDVVYVTWGTHVLAALVTAKAWYLYFAIPAYATYKLVTVAWPYIAPRLGLGGAGGAAVVPDSQAQDSGESKRQQKLRARAERGDPRVQQRRVRR